MRIVQRFGILTALVFLCAAVAIPAQAAMVDYDTGGWGPQQFPGPDPVPAGAPNAAYPGDTVEATAYSGTGINGLDLSPGVYNLKVNTLEWTIDYTWAGGTNPNAGASEWDDLFFPFTVTRTITVGGVSGQISQDGLLETTWDNDYLSLDEGDTLFLLVSGYNVAITPLALPRVGGSDFSSGPPWAQPDRDILARFEVSPVPLPAALPLFGSGLAILGYAGWRRKRTATA